jgi:hypothetical protein
MVDKMYARCIRNETRGATEKRAVAPRTQLRPWPALQNVDSAENRTIAPSISTLWRYQSKGVLYCGDVVGVYQRDLHSNLMARQLMAEHQSLLILGKRSTNRSLQAWQDHSIICISLGRLSI